MLSNGVLKHAASESPLATFQFDSPVLYNLLIAVLTALLSYQAVGTVFDLLLGCKPRGLAKLTDLFILHFSERLSIFSVLPELFQNLKLSNIRHHGLRHEMHIKERRGSFSTLVALKLLLLLSCGPVINLVSIALSLEVNTDLTFSAAKFGGLALGKAKPGMATKSFLANGMCVKFLTEFGAGVANVPDFFVCGDFFLPTDDLSNVNTTLRIVQAPSSLKLEIITAGLNYRIIVNAPVRIGSQKLKLRQLLSTEEVQSLWYDFGNRFRKSCESGESDIIEQGALSEEFHCKTISYLAITQLFHDFRLAFTLVETDRFEVSEDGRRFRSGDDLLLFTRRRPYISLISLIVATVVAVLIRVVTNYVTNNDIDIGMELLLRQGLRVEGFDTMLCLRNVVMYNEAAEFELSNVSSSISSAESFEGDSNDPQKVSFQSPKPDDYF